MSSDCWRLTGGLASLELKSLAAQLDASAASPGLTHLALRHRALPGNLLQVHLRPDQSHAASMITRGCDAIVNYSASGDWPFCIQVYWRAQDDVYPGAIAAIELQVSIQTDLLDTHPKLLAGSRLPAADALSLADTAAADQHLDPSRGPLAIDRTTGAGALILRLPESDLSYVEIVHPADFQLTRVEAFTSREVGTSHTLFARPLEKGVILRCRVLGLFVERENDVQRARAAWQIFRASAPPLTT